MAQKLINIVVPVFNEAKGLEVLYSRLENIINKLPYNFEIIFVNDGSFDNSLETLISLHEAHEGIKIINLSRNFGHQNALMAGIEQTKSEATILMDADLEDDPKYITSFIDYWNQGYDVVYAKRKKRKTSIFRNICFAIFHKINRAISNIDMDSMGIFCLMDRKVVEHMQSLTEKDKYIPGLRSWIGFKQIGIETVREARYDNNPRVKFTSLVKLAFDSFTSFSTLPLKISMFFGITFSLFSFIGIAVVVTLKIFFKIAIQGWASIISVILLLGGIQLICIGLQGEYLLRIFNEVKSRPNYIIKDKIGFK